MVGEALCALDGLGSRLLECLVQESTVALEESNTLFFEGPDELNYTKKNRNQIRGAADDSMLREALKSKD